MNENLSRDIRLLGGLLGEIIKDQHGPDAFLLEEEVRSASREQRKNHSDAEKELTHLIGDTSLEQKRILTKAFSNYFQLINIAEDQERIRVLRDRERQGNLRESIDVAVAQLADNGVTAEAMRGVLNELRIRLVLTAHPSEAKRKEILIKLRSIADLLARLEYTSLLPREEQSVKDELAAEIEELWQTKTIRSQKTTVADEVDFGLYFVTSVIMDVTVEIYDTLQKALEYHYPDEDWNELPPVLQFASWIGSDRDGNPNVTPQTTLETLATLRKAACQSYLADVLELRDHLTQALGETEISTELQAALEQKVNDNGRYYDEPYRRYMHYIYQQLENNAYHTSQDLLNDILLVYNSLDTNRGKRIANHTIRRLVRKIKLFGLHLTPLEVREDAGLHASTIAELFQRYDIAEDYLSLTEDEKQALLLEELDNRRPLFPTTLDDLGATTARTIQTWQMIASAHQEYGPDVIDTVIASMSRRPSDVLTMLLFAQEVGIHNYVDIVPLFETIEDLRNAPETMQRLFDTAAYAQHLKMREQAHGRLYQQIMIGYSDSSKDGGYLASNWQLHTAQKRVADACLERGVAVAFFHGRGGSIGRGGGPTNRAIRSHPPQALRGGIKMTEQGEVIAYRYSNSAIAYRHLQQVLNAMLIALTDGDSNAPQPDWADAMQRLAELGRKTYRSLVYDDSERFLPYWEATTPIKELGKLQISSRPTKRSSAGGFSAMRAIPWAFSWMQSRGLMPSWFGNGTAFETFCEEREDGLALLQTMYREWPFFTTLIDNAQLVIVKADMSITELYSQLARDDAIREEIFGRIKAEYDLTATWIENITEQPLLSKMQAVRTSIERRNPYIDPLNYIQVELLTQLRSFEDDSTHSEYQPTLEAVLATINGIAAGMKTTG